MNLSVYLRPLKSDDAKISYNWRNDSRIWTLTASQPDKYITVELETEWIEDCLRKEDQHRFAICLKDSDQYIGNIYLIDITPVEAHFSGVFIGYPELWNQGIGFRATELLLNYSFIQLQLQKIYGFVLNHHKASLRMLEKLWFDTSGQADENFRYVFITKAMYESPQRSSFI